MTTTTLTIQSTNYNYTYNGYFYDDYVGGIISDSYLTDKLTADKGSPPIVGDCLLIPYTYYKYRIYKCTAINSGSPAFTIILSDALNIR